MLVVQASAGTPVVGVDRTKDTTDPQSTIRLAILDDLSAVVTLYLVAFIALRLCATSTDWLPASYKPYRTGSLICTTDGLTSNSRKRSSVLSVLLTLGR